jgi:hypothetical protein
MVAVFDFLKSFELWQSLLYIGGIVLILLIFIVVTKPSVRFLNFSLSFFGKKSNLPIFLQFKRDIEKKIYFIEYIGIVKAQMKRIDSMLHRVKDLLMENYANLILSEVQDQETTTHSEYLTYAALIEVMLFLRVKDKIRELVLDEENSIPEIASDNFENFSKNLTMNMYECGKSYLDLFYGKGHLISREVLRQANLDLLPDFERCTRESLRDIKLVELDMKKKIEELKEQLRSREKAVLGITLT